jgi:hypothetical protein
VWLHLYLELEAAAFCLRTCSLACFLQAHKRIACLKRALVHVLVSVLRWFSQQRSRVVLRPQALADKVVGCCCCALLLRLLCVLCSC